ncbi:MFS general substrate transporter [Aspergillus niger ATCC 13496]|uniref:MFS general substrate transporter n=1 Tax=Aspergillus niger ATCC 13496 TaxID=1353008 RepID=A0A370BMQ7_ASPNG|nr:MFS general substrate transporter [Aspergillus niger ATCC 13496]
MPSASPTLSLSDHDDESQEDSVPLIVMNEAHEELQDTSPPADIFEVLVLASGFGTLQLVFALLASYGSAQLLSVGISQAATGLAWLAGPLAGTFFQPLIGIISDKFGHQKIIVATGVIGLVASLLGLGWAPDLKEQSSEIAKALVLFFICTLNLAVQPVQLGLRVLIIELCRPEQQIMASAWVTRMIGIGNIIAQLAGSIDTTKLRPFTTGYHFKDLCLLTSIGLIITATSLGLFVRAVTDPISPPERRNNQQSRLVGSWKAIRTVFPGAMSVWRVQVFSWMGWFQFLYYATMYIDSLALNDLLQDANITDEEGQRSIRTESLQFGPRAMLLNACVSFVSSMLLPWLFKYNERSKGKSSNHLTLSNIWAISQALFGAGMILTLWVSSVIGATFIISILGLSWCCTAWIPFTLMSTKILQESRNALRPHNPGLIMSLHNVSIAAPQILAALIAGLVFWVSQDGENQARYVLAVGGLFGLGAAWMARGLTIEKELH